MQILKKIICFLYSHITSCILYFGSFFSFKGTSLVAQMVKNLPAMWETWVQSLSQEDPQEEGMATHSSILAWRIPWREESGRIQSTGMQRITRDWSDWAQAWALELRLSSCHLRGLSCPAACGIFLDQGSNLCLLHWQVDSFLLSLQGSPSSFLGMGRSESLGLLK